MNADVETVKQSPFSCCKLPYKCVQYRYVFVFVGLLMTMSGYMTRSNVNLTIVAMVDTEDMYKGLNKSAYCNINSSASQNQHVKNAGRFKWSKMSQGLILGGFYNGYFLMQLIGCLVAYRLSPKWVAFCGHLTSSIIDTLIPSIAPVHSMFVFSAKMAQGMCQGFTIPSYNALIGHWVPVSERTRSVAIFFSGNQLAMVFGQLIAGYLSNPYYSKETGGYKSDWAVVFYLCGGFGILSCALWALLVYDNPCEHPIISYQEKKYIMRSLSMKSQVPNVHSPPSPKELRLNKLKKFKVPWREIFRSKVFWAICCAHTCFDWGWYTMVTCLPTYMSTVLGFNLKDNGSISAIPYALQWVAAILVSMLSDFYIGRNIFTVTTVRKINTCICLVGLGISLIAAGAIGCDVTWAMVLFSANFVLMGMSPSGFITNIVDIAPKYAGIIFALSNTIATLPGLFSPLLVSALTREKSNLDNWMTVFYTSAGIAWFGSLIYYIFAKANIQPWAVEEDDYSQVGEVKRDTF